MHAVEPVGQAIGSCGLFEWAFGPRNPMKNWSSRIGGADPLGRGRPPRRPAGAPQDADVVVWAAGRGRLARTRGSAPPAPRVWFFDPVHLLQSFLPSDSSDANQKRAGAHQHDRTWFRAGGGRIDYECLGPPRPVYIFQEENSAEIEVSVRRRGQQVQIVLHPRRNRIRASRKHVPDVVLKIDLILGGVSRL